MAEDFPSAIYVNSTHTLQHRPTLDLTYMFIICEHEAKKHDVSGFLNCPSLCYDRSESWLSKTRREDDSYIWHKADQKHAPLYATASETRLRVGVGFLLHRMHSYPTRPDSRYFSSVPRSAFVSSRTTRPDHYQLTSLSEVCLHDKSVFITSVEKYRVWRELFGETLKMLIVLFTSHSRRFLLKMNLILAACNQVVLTWYFVADTLSVLQSFI